MILVALSQRSIILDHWKLLETEIGDEVALSRVEAMMPKPMRRWRKLDDTGDKEECELSVDQGR